MAIAAVLVSCSREGLAIVTCSVPQHDSDSVSGRGFDSHPHHLKPEEQMARTVSDSGFSVLQSSVLCISRCEWEAEGHLHSSWSESHIYINC